MLQAFGSCVRQGQTADADESAKPKIAMFGLKKVLDIYYILSNGKTITDASGTVSLLRQAERGQTIPNIFQQFVIEVRAAILPSLMELWDSSLVEKLPEATTKRLVDILKMVAGEEGDPPAISHDKVSSLSMLPNSLRRTALNCFANTRYHKAPFYLLQYTDARFNWRSVRRAVEELRGGEFTEDLIQEAIFRANGNASTARDYCTAHSRGLAGSPNPIPSDDSDTSELVSPPKTRTDRTPSQGAGSSDPDRMSLDEPPFTPRENLGDPDNRGSQVIDDGSAEGRNRPSRDEPTDHPRGTPGSKNASTHGNPFLAAKDTLEKQRSNLRKDLIDRCLDVIRNHPNSAIEVSELIYSLVIRHQVAETHEEVCVTVTSAISSLRCLDEDDVKKNGRCIASFAHLLGLLLQDEQFFQNNIDLLRGTTDDYISLLNFPAPATSSELPPWVPYILLILESFLRHDARPIAAQWKPPKSLDELVAAPVIRMPTLLVDPAQQRQLTDAILNLLRRVGKEEVIATSVLRLLVILTRDRSLAKYVGDKKNLQLLFLMAKQLVATGFEKIKQSKLTQQVMTILRHVIEDEDTVKQILRTEIKREFAAMTRNQRSSPDIPAYLRQMSPLALRAPAIFVDLTNELMEIAKWNPSHVERPFVISLKELVDNKSDSEEVKEDRATDGSATQDVKQSTEPADKDMHDAPKPQDSKRPLVENPDGVVHFLLSELVNYREVDDKEVSLPSKDTEVEIELSEQDHATPPNTDSIANDKKDKKSTKPIFKSEEHPIFIYRCFLLNCLTELLQSYNRTKVEFINFKRSAPPLSTGTPVKPRTSVLNYLIYDLLCQGNLSGTNDTIAAKKKSATSTHTQKLLVALVSKTKERPFDRISPKYAYDEELELQFVRKFVLDTILKAYERTPGSDESLEIRYSRMQSLSELMNHMVGERDKEHGANSRTPDSIQARSQLQLRRLMFEKGYLEKLTSSIAEINLNYPGVKRAIKYILRVLRVLTDTAKELSQSDLLPNSADAAEHVDEDLYSNSSLSELEDGREDTPDLYRNSSLGMLEPRDDDESGEDDEDVEDIYGDEYDDEMEYEEEGISDDDQDNISEDSEMGEIEGLSGDPRMVEVIMDEDEDDEDDDDSDSDDDDDEDDSEDLDSADMEDVESRVEIVNEDGHPMEDDGESGWESDDADDDDLEAELDYEAEVQDADEAHMHGIGPRPADLLNNMARALIEGDEYDPDLMDEHYLDDAHDDDGTIPPILCHVVPEPRN